MIVVERYDKGIPIFEMLQDIDPGRDSPLMKAMDEARRKLVRKAGSPPIIWYEDTLYPRLTTGTDVDKWWRQYHRRYLG